MGNTALPAPIQFFTEFRGITNTMFEIGDIVTVEGWKDTTQHLIQSVGKRAKVIAFMPPFVIIDVEDIGIRACLAEFLQPVVTEEVVVKRYLETA